MKMLMPFWLMKVRPKPLEKRLKIDALLEEQRLNKLKRALEDGDDFTEFGRFR